MPKRKKSGKFMKGTVIFCIGFVALYTVWAAWEFHREGLEPVGLTAAVYAFFGTELAVLCIKRIFAKQDDRRQLHERMNASDDDR